MKAQGQLIMSNPVNISLHNTVKSGKYILVNFRKVLIKYVVLNITNVRLVHTVNKHFKHTMENYHIMSHFFAT